MSITQEWLMKNKSFCRENNDILDVCIKIKRFVGERRAFVLQQHIVGPSKEFPPAKGSHFVARTADKRPRNSGRLEFSPTNGGIQSLNIPGLLSQLPGTSNFVPEQQDSPETFFSQNDEVSPNP